MSEIDTTRNPGFVADRALVDWTAWHPGDGSSYRVRIITISNGPDSSDRLLLLNIQRCTIAFQWSNLDYRHREMEMRWTKRKCRDEGMPPWAWEAARALLDVLGATRKHSAKPRVRTVQTVGDAL